MVKIDFSIGPGVASVGFTSSPVRDDRWIQFFPTGIETLVKLASEELDAHDTEDEPEDHTDDKYVKDGGDGHHEGIDNNLKMQETKHNHTYRWVNNTECSITNIVFTIVRICVFFSSNSSLFHAMLNFSQ